MLAGHGRNGSIPACVLLRLHMESDAGVLPQACALTGLARASVGTAPLAKSFAALSPGDEKMANLLGALIGAAIDRQEGGSGIGGAIEGTIAEYAIRALAPVVATYALGWAVQYGLRKGWHALVGYDPV